MNDPLPQPRWLNHAAGRSIPERLSGDRRLLNLAIDRAMKAGELTVAGDLATELALLRRGSHWHRPLRGELGYPAIPQPDNPLSAGKLAHDIAHLRYLRDKRLIGREFTTAIAHLERMHARLLPLGDSARQTLAPSDRSLIGEVYNRIVYLRETPRLSGRALSATWDSERIEERYLRHPLGLVVVDDFLCREALESLRAYCVQSTVWFANRYANGRLGAFFRDGFNCPLLIQIAEELREALPTVIGDKFPLEQLWAFKYPPIQPKMSAHADFAAVNVNFWITPDEANLDRRTGGMVVYDVEAPLDWDFESYNRGGRTIEQFLNERQARGIVVPYRANRVVIFNSDLFHTTDALHFRDEYENRRINVTMLYGQRSMAPAAAVPRRAAP
jgi:hypothetical protein